LTVGGSTKNPEFRRASHGREYDICIGSLHARRKSSKGEIFLTRTPVSPGS
jgi:hypothetical protein